MSPNSVIMTRATRVPFVKAESSPYLHFGPLVNFIRLFTYGFKKSYNINKENDYYKYLRNNAMFKN